MTKMDVECFLDQVEIFLKDKLNDKIAEIDAEKNSGWTTEPVDPESYIFQSLDELASNFDPILFYGISSVEGESIESANGKTYAIEISVIKTDDESKTIGRKLLRYQRALEEIFQENYVKINSVRQKIKVSSLQPISFQTQNSSNRFKAIGIEIEFSIY